MSPKKFRLQSVLDYREQRVEQRKQELAVLNGKVQAQQRILDAVRWEMAALATRIEETQTSGLLDCSQLIGQFTFLQKLEAREQDESALLAGLIGQAGAKREELAVAMRDKQVLEKLKTRFLEAEQREQERRDAHFLDEIGVTRFRNASGPGD